MNFKLQSSPTTPPSYLYSCYIFLVLQWQPSAIFGKSDFTECSIHFLLFYTYHIGHIHFYKNWILSNNEIPYNENFICHCKQDTIYLNLCMYNGIQKKNLFSFFSEMDKAILKFTWNTQNREETRQPWKTKHNTTKQNLPHYTQNLISDRLPI